jgi:hypothetical protein
MGWPAEHRKNGIGVNELVPAVDVDQADELVDETNALDTPSVSRGSEQTLLGWARGEPSLATARPLTTTRPAPSPPSTSPIAARAEDRLDAWRTARRGMRIMVW